MKVRILTTDRQYLDFDTDNLTQYGSGTGIFKMCENMFWSWFNSQNPAQEVEQQYFGEEAIYTKKGAILQLIEAMSEYLENEELPKKLYTETELMSADIDATLS